MIKRASAAAWCIVAMSLLCTSCTGTSTPTARSAPGVAIPCRTADPSLAGPRVAADAMRHYEYVFPDGSIEVFDIDANHCLVKSIPVPTRRGVRGIAASPATGMLYIAYGGDGGKSGYGSLLKYDLRSDSVIWTRNYSFGIDSFDITPDGSRIYMPEGEQASGSSWYVLDAMNGDERGVIHGGKGPHNTVVSRNGKLVYLGPRFDPYLYVADVQTGTVIKRVGPVRGDGVRPFTVNAAETLAFITASGFLGFQVGDLRTGRILYTVHVSHFSVPFGFPASTPSHGISLSPDERELYLIDTANSEAHVFDVSSVPNAAPKQISDLALQGKTVGDESPCAYDCLRDGWLQHDLSGRFVYVGDSGDVIDTSRRTTVTVLKPLRNTRKMLEIDFDGRGSPRAATPREGIGYVGASA